MRFKESVLLRKPTGGLLKSGDEKGVARFEDDGVKKLKVSTVGLQSEKLYLKYSMGKFSISFPYSQSGDAEYLLPGEAPSGGGVLIFDEEQNPVLYGAFSNRATPIEDMLKDYSPEIYDDEIVATENYYEYDKIDADSANNQLIGGLNGDSGGLADDKNEMPRKENSGEKQANGKKGDAIENENAFDDKNEKPGEFSGNYYKKIEGELNKLFDNEKEESLSEVVKDSKWVKISYGEGKHYVVGLIYERGKPRWICYGVPGKYGERPTEIKDYCSFIPSSLFDLKGTGYWVMYQDAENGNIVA